MVNRQRNVKLEIRLSPEEKELFRERFEKSKYPGQADFLMALLAKKPIVVIEDLKTVTTELRRQGTNLNQIARHLNSGGMLDVEIMAAITDCRQFFKKLRRMELK